jgi:hypothetical protein
VKVLGCTGILHSGAEQAVTFMDKVKVIGKRCRYKVT